jgi:hypothetical protein
MINSMLNHVALLKPPLPQLNVIELVSWYVSSKVVSALFTTLFWGGGGGGGGGDNVFLAMFNNFVILAGMVSRVLSKIV